MKGKVVVRRATLEDLPVILDLLGRGVAEGKLLERSLTLLETIIRCIFVAEIEEHDRKRVVAMASLERYAIVTNDAEGEPIGVTFDNRLAEIRMVYVLPEFRENGIGEALIERLVEEVKRFRILSLMVVTKDAKFFEKFGFTNLLQGQVILHRRSGPS